MTSSKTALSGVLTPVKALHPPFLCCIFANMKGKWILLTLTLLALIACTADHEAMRQRLKYVSDCNRADTVFTEQWLPTVDSLVSYFDRHGSANDRMMAHYVRGRVYHDMGEAPQALECYQKAAEQADTTRRDCDLYTLYAVYGQMSVLFHSQYLPDDEMQALQMAERIAWKDRDTLSAISSYQLLSRPFFLQKDTEKVLSIEQHAFDLYLKYGYLRQAARVLRVPISIYIDHQEFDRAHKAMQVFENESGWFDEDGNIKKGKELYYYDKGRYMLATGNSDSALLFFQKTLSAGKTEAGYKGLLLYYKKQNKADSISKYAELYSAANDSCYYRVDQAHLKQVSSMYNYSRQQRLAEQNAVRAKSNAITAFVFFIIAIVLLCIVILPIDHILKKNKERASLIERIDDSNREIENLTKEIEFLNQLRNESMDMSTNSKIDQMKELLTEKEKSILSLRSRIHYYKKKLNPNLLLSDKEDFHNSQIYEVFKTYLKVVTRHPSEDEWDDLYSYIESVLPSFKSILMHERPLAESEYRICCLIRMGFSPSEVSVLTGAPNVSVVRKRLHKKILKQSGSPKDFDIFLFGIK